MMAHFFEALLKGWKLFFSEATVKMGAENTGCVEACDKAAEGFSKLKLNIEPCSGGKFVYVAGWLML